VLAALAREEKRDRDRLLGAAHRVETSRTSRGELANDIRAVTRDDERSVREVPTATLQRPRCVVERSIGRTQALGETPGGFPQRGRRPRRQRQ
jgi:hypothetical protein